MHILIAGGAGFIGSNLCQRLLEQEHQVTCVDNLLTGSEENISSLIKNQRFKFINHDITLPLSPKIKVDQVYHFASPASPNIHSRWSYHALPFETMWANTIGTRNLCELALKNQAKFLFASTSETYGDPLEHPQREDYRGNVSTIGPRSVYDEAKRFGETITAAYVRHRGLDGRIIRIFNTYGPRMRSDDGRVVVNFILQALANKPLAIFGNGNQTRSFCYIDDLLEGIILAMNKPKTKGEIFNLGNPGEFSIRQLAKKIKKITGSKSKIIFAEARPDDDPQRRRPDITKAKKVLDWQPRVNLDSGLKRFITHLRGFALLKNS